jgi:hypothetical protein
MLRAAREVISAAQRDVVARRVHKDSIDEQIVIAWTTRISWSTRWHLQKQDEGDS